jgi:hypothetical protein
MLEFAAFFAVLGLPTEKCTDFEEELKGGEPPLDSSFRTFQ